MKKLVLALLLIQMVFTSMCQAFEQPDSDRWLWLGSDDELGVWIDKQTVKYHRGEGFQYVAHENHAMVDVWVMLYKNDKKTTSLQRQVHDIDCDMVALTSYSIRDENGKVIGSQSLPIIELRSTVPGSLGEAIGMACKEFWANDERNNVR